MNRRFTHRLLGAVGLSLLISCGYPTLNQATTQSIAQAQNQQSSSSGMTLSDLASILEAEGTDVEGSNGQWQVTIEDRTLLVLADESNNRMRIFTPVIPAENLSAQQIQSVLLANFHTALDARYALSENALVSVFVHPLGSLNESDLRSALSQVATLANTFGSSYTSGALDFGPSGPANSGSPEQLAI
ncbi:MAG: hypothetical protein AAFQ63_02485 [Cyanobacteria bacterium J06621_11]